MPHLAKNVGEHHGKYSWERNSGIRRSQGLIWKNYTFNRLSLERVYSHDKYKEDERT